MEENINTVKLGNYILDIAAGPFGSNLKVDCFVPQGFPIIDGANLKSFKVTDNVTKFVTEEKARSLYRSIAKRNDVVVTISGNVGQISYIPAESKYEEYLVSQRQFRVTFDPKRIYVPYLVYYFHTLEGQHKILSFANQTGVPALAQPLKNFRNIDIYLPDIQTQRRIANVIESLDDKIELNNRINHNLEEQLKQLYQRCITNCACESIRLGDVIKTTSGGTPSRNNTDYYGSEIPWVKSKELKGGFIFDTEESITNKGLDNSSAKLLPSHCVLIAMYGATVGEYGITTKPVTCNQAICALIPNDSYPLSYLYMFAKENKDNLVNSAVGSAQQNISQVIIKDMLVCSNLDLISGFDNLASPVLHRMEVLSEESKYLSSVRDNLLPKLVSGEMNINEIDC